MSNPQEHVGEGYQNGYNALGDPPVGVSPYAPPPPSAAVGSNESVNVTASSISSVVPSRSAPLGHLHPATQFPSGSRVYVQMRGINEPTLREMFAPFAPLPEVKVINYDAGFVQLSSPAHATASIAALNNTLHHGQNVLVEIARDTVAKPNSHSTGGGGSHSKAAGAPCFKCGQSGHWQASGKKNAKGDRGEGNTKRNTKGDSETRMQIELN